VLSVRGERVCQHNLSSNLTARLTRFLEYISQLESEIAGKVSDNNDLRKENIALAEENKRLTDLTRMLLSSPSFSNFLNHLSTDPAAMPQGMAIKTEPQQQQQQQQQQPQQQQEQRQIPKDPNPFGAQTQQQIGMAMIPEQQIDFSMLNIDNSYTYTPQVFVVDTPEIPAPIDMSVLTGKPSLLEETLSFEEDKNELPAIERPAEVVEAASATESLPVDEEFESDPEFVLFHTKSDSTSEASQPATSDVVSASIFGAIPPEKALSRYELVDATEEEASASLALERILRLNAHIEPMVSRLEILTRDL
jgi:hypothetical protein